VFCIIFTLFARMHVRVITDITFWCILYCAGTDYDARAHAPTCSGSIVDRRLRARARAVPPSGIRGVFGVSGRDRIICSN
jgi:hypothetical protein